MAKRSNLEVVSKGMYWDGPGGTWQLAVHFADIDGRRECVGMEIRSVEPTLAVDDDGQPCIRYRKLRGVDPHRLTATAWRAIPVAALTRWAREELKVELGAGAEDQEINEEERRALLDAARSLEVRPNTYDETHFARVADIYQQAWKAGDAPTKAVADELNASRTAAAKWVARARKMGLLGETEKRKPGGVTAPAKRKGR